MKKYLLTACLSLTVVTTVVAQTPKTYELTATPATRRRSRFSRSTRATGYEYHDWQSFPIVIPS